VIVGHRPREGFERRFFERSGRIEIAQGLDGRSDDHPRPLKVWVFDGQPAKVDVESLHREVAGCLQISEGPQRPGEVEPRHRGPRPGLQDALLEHAGSFELAQVGQGRGKVGLRGDEMGMIFAEHSRERFHGSLLEDPCAFEVAELAHRPGEVDAGHLQLGVVFGQ
jgi:hypothetical protein